MPFEENFSDDYVATLLVDDAKASTAKYSTAGLQALLPKRPTTAAPKANTRFLRNIIKETDSHNATLRAKEIHDAKARLRRLHGGNLVSSDSKRRVDEDDQHHRKRRRQHHRTDDSRPLLQGPEKLDSSRKRHNSEQHDERSRRHQLNHNSSDQSLDEYSRSHWRRYQHHRRSHRRRSRNRSKDRDTTRYRGKCHRHKDRSRSPVVDPPQSHNSRRRRERSVSLSSTRNRARPCKADASSKTESYSQRREKVNDEPVSQGSDSDPLESIIGPHPPPQPPQIQARGRGTFASTAIDSHFCSQYDPAEDIHPNSDSENDWDQALEALRDRQRWKQQGADRLRAAGFTEEEVGNWEKGGEKREEDVKWKGKGEGREWDRGKVVIADGVETKPEWGRLKGT